VPVSPHRLSARHAMSDRPDTPIPAPAYHKGPEPAVADSGMAPPAALVR
jgi:hypothetical protein